MVSTLIDHKREWGTLEWETFEWGTLANTRMANARKHSNGERVRQHNQAEIDFKDRKDGSCYVSYKVTEVGEYRVSIKFNEQHIPDSPFKVSAHSIS